MVGPGAIAGAAAVSIRKHAPAGAFARRSLNYRGTFDVVVVVVVVVRRVLRGVWCAVRRAVEV